MVHSLFEPVPGNAISGEIKWERRSERKISIFYEHFPRPPLGFLWLSASNRIPSPLIPFSKNVIRKSPLDFLLPRSLPVWARQRSLTSSRASLALSLARLSQPLLVVLFVFCFLSYLSRPCAVVGPVHSCCRWLPVCPSPRGFGCIFICHRLVCGEKSAVLFALSLSASHSFFPGSWPSQYSQFITVQTGSCFNHPFHWWWQHPKIVVCCESDTSVVFLKRSRMGVRKKQKQTSGLLIWKRRWRRMVKC